jgi:hypothetical protein
MHVKHCAAVDVEEYIFLFSCIIFKTPDDFYEVENVICYSVKAFISCPICCCL